MRVEISRREGGEAVKDGGEEHSLGLGMSCFWVA